MFKNVLIALLFCYIIIGCSTAKNKSVKTNFSKEQIDLIMSLDSLKPMRVYKITNKKDSLLLRKKSAYIIPDSTDVILQSIVKRLYRTVRDSMSLGVGIAAPQVGILKNIIWVQRFDKNNVPFEVYLNPNIVHYSERKQIFMEGCLSIPNRVDTVKTRSYDILIEYDNMKAGHKTEKIEGFTSVIFQHEIDHLNGILYLDHLDKEMIDAKKNNN